MIAKNHPPKPSLRVQLEAALLQLGIDPKSAHLDHSPALAFREYDPETGRYTPDANDPRYLQWLSAETHAKKTHGPRGDIAMSAKVKRLTKKQEEFRKTLLAKSEPGAAPQKRPWPKRKFHNGPKNHHG